MPSALCQPKIGVLAAAEEKTGENPRVCKKTLENLETAVGEDLRSVRVAPSSLADTWRLLSFRAIVYLISTCRMNFVKTAREKAMPALLTSKFIRELLEKMAQAPKVLAPLVYLSLLFGLS